MAATPLGLGGFIIPVTQGSSFLATLGWRPESRWDLPMGAVMLANSAHAEFFILLSAFIISP